MQKDVMALGGGKVMFSAIIPATLECSNMNVINVTRNKSLNGISNCIISGMCNLKYPILVANESEKTLSTVCKSMSQNDVRVGIIPKDTNLFTEMIEKGDGGVWFSACREGLYLTYLPIMEKYITKPTHIFVFDNDETIVEKAKEICQNTNIKIHKCIIHSVCSEINYDYAEGAMYLTSGKECMLVFPPDAPNMTDLFKGSPIFGRAEFKFTTSKEAYHYYSMWKPLGINAMHTLASVVAYVKGTKKGIPFADISSKRFSELIPREDLCTFILRVYSLLYDKHLAPYAKTVGAHKDTYVTITKSFIDGLYDMNETIGRGLDPQQSSFDSKLKQHFPLLKDSEDQETIIMLNEFLALL